MDGQVPKAGKEVPRLEVPEDVAVLYAWANLQGARYRDFSASRRESRAQTRQRAAQAKREAEARAKASAEECAERAEQAAREATEAARFHQAQARRAFGEHRRAELEREQAARERALSDAENLNRRAAQDRAEAARHAAAFHQAENLARHEAQEMAEAHASAQRQAERYAMSESRSSGSASDREGGPGPSGWTAGSPTLGGGEHLSSAGELSERSMLPERFPRRRESRIVETGVARAFDLALEEAGEDYAPMQGALFSASAETPEIPQFGYAPDQNERMIAVEEYARSMSPRPSHAQRTERPEIAAAMTKMVEPASPEAPGTEASVDLPHSDAAAAPEIVGNGENEIPAWIKRQSPQRPPGSPSQRPPAVSPVTDTLQHSRERVASRWYALRGVFDPSTPEMEPTQARAREARSPFLAIFSLAGGVGKTSVAASLGRSLSAAGEKILLVDVTPQGILPFYFGATELRQGVVRTFAPPEGSSDAPISMVSYDVFGRGGTGGGAEADLLQQLGQNRDTFSHLLIDLSPAAVPVLRQLTQMDATVLVPVAPDMNTVITLRTMERFFADMVDSSGRKVQPQYLLTQFDTALPLHLDVREGLRQKLGDRLLPFAIRRAPEVAEALAEGMTVIDYAPRAGVASDYAALASWVRTLQRQNATPAKGVRWSER